jgi:hypothetical protein
MHWTRPVYLGLGTVLSRTSRSAEAPTSTAPPGPTHAFSTQTRSFQLTLPQSMLPRFTSSAISSNSIGLPCFKSSNADGCRSPLRTAHHTFPSSSFYSGSFGGNARCQALLARSAKASIAATGAGSCSCQRGHASGKACMVATDSGGWLELSNPTAGALQS